MKSFLKSCLEKLTLHRRNIFWAIAATLLVSQFATLVYSIARYSTSQEILQAFDDDAAAAAEVAGKTYWFLDNHWSAYGPLYYRLTHTLSALSPLESDANTHFHLLLTSLIMAYGLCALLAWALGVRGPELVLSTCILLSCFLSEETWRTMLLRAHPDWLLSFAAALTAFAIFRLRDAATRSANHNSSDLKSTWLGLLALSMALGMLTKATYMLFIPTVLILFLSDARLRPHWKQVALWSLGWYFLIGFPQAFRIDRDVKFLLTQSAYNQSPDLESAVIWVRQFGTQLLPALLGSLGVWFVFSSERPNDNQRGRWFEIPILFLPLLILMTRKVVSQFDHYTLPFVAFFLMGFACRMTQSWPVGLRSFQSRLRLGLNDRFRQTAFVVTILAASIFGLLTPKNLDARLNSELTCRSEAEEVVARTVDLFENGQRIYLDPYVPFARRGDTRSLRVGGWRNTWDDLKLSQAQWMILNEQYYKRYLVAPSDYVKVDNPKLAQSQEFYAALNRVSSMPDTPSAPSAQSATVTSPSGDIWELEKGYSCGFRIWKLKPEN